MQTAVWLDGHLVDPSAPHLAVDDHGPLVGDGAFETLVVVGSGPDRVAFALTRHLERLERSLAALGLDAPHSRTELAAAVAETVAAAPAAHLVRVYVTSGRGPLGSGRGDGPPTTVVIAGGARPDHRPGTAVAVFPHPRNERGALAGVKSISYAENVVALRHARARGATEALFADTRGHLSEGTGSNVFWSDGERLYTPPLDTGCLAGVTRALVVENLEVTESHLPVADLAGASEAFLTSTTRGVQSIARVDDTPLAVVDGPFTARAAAVIDRLMAEVPDP
ncbi:MAG: 4-amino-4-deoxychorismate lyase [Actinomyces sp.]|nr:MAG: 4-amino-4-deoxychorismate lyase [Actinomyces sp.]